MAAVLITHLLLVYLLIPPSVQRLREMQILEHPPSSQNVSKGETVRIKCRAKFAESVTWEISTASIRYSYAIWRLAETPRFFRPNSRDSRVNWDWNSHNVQIYDLIISDARKSDEGQYWCVIRGPGNLRFESRSCELRVFYSDDHLFEKAPKNIFTVSGKGVRFQCKFSQDSQVRWRFFPANASIVHLLGVKQNTDLARPMTYKPDRFSWGSRNSSSTDLVISKVMKSDEGRYACESFLQHGWHHREATLVVIELPTDQHRSLYPTTVYKFIQNRTRHVFCNAVDFSTAQKIVWFDEHLNVIIYNRVKVTQNPRITVDLENKRKVGFSQIWPEDASSYYCISLTSSVPKMFEIQVHVKGCPSPKSPLLDGEWFEGKKFGKCYGTDRTKHVCYGQAEVWCRKQGGFLVMPRTMLEESRLRTINHVNESLWIGLSDWEKEGVWKWSDGRLLLPSQTRWFNLSVTDSYYPLNEKHHCARMWKAGGWYDADCGNSNPFLCEIPLTDWERSKRRQEKRCPEGWMYFDCGDFCYKPNMSRLSWDKANEHCESVNAKLTMPKTPSQHRNVKALLGTVSSSFASFAEAWIGLTKSQYGTGWEWNDGVVEHWIYWEPSTVERNPGEVCVTMKQSGHNNARVCSDKHYTICQRPQEIIRDPILSTPVCGETSVQFDPSKRTTRSAESDLRIGKILNGEHIGIEKVPWAVRIVLRKHLFTTCTGVLISDRHVLTCAHCVVKENDQEFTSQAILVGLGTEDNDPSRLEGVHNIVVYPEYVGNKRNLTNVFYTWHHDIAIIELKRSVHTDCWNTRAACFLDTKDPQFSPPFRGYECLVAGWGIGSRDSMKYCHVHEHNIKTVSGPLRSVFHIYVSQHSCRPARGDSGAGLMCLNKLTNRWHLAGLETSSFPKKKEVVFVQTSSFVQWIKDEIKGS